MIINVSSVQAKPDEPQTPETNVVWRKLNTDNRTKTRDAKKMGRDATDIGSRRDVEVSRRDGVK